MSFWDLSDGDTAKNTGTEYEVPTGNMDPIPAGSSVLALIDDIKWERKQTGEEFISARWTVLAPDEYKNRKVFHKLWVTDLDPSSKDQSAAVKKRDKARKMLAAIDANAGGKLTQKPGIPSGDDLLHLSNKPMVCTMMEWEMPDTRNGGTMRGNWVSAVASKNSKDIYIADAKPSSAGRSAPQRSRDDFGAAPATGGYAKPAMMDEEIPFCPRVAHLSESKRNASAAKVGADYPENSEARRWQLYNTWLEPKMEQRTEEWFEARKGRITASSVGAILGNAPYATRDDVMRRMVREWHGAPTEFEGNIATEYGVRNEAGALTEYQMETGNAVQAVGFITREDWAGCSPDGFVSDNYGLEIKCPFGLRKDEVPAFKTLEDQPHYYDQIQFSMWVTGRPWWDFYQWSPRGSALEGVKMSVEWQDENLPRLRQFYAEYLAEREDPAIHLEPKRPIIDTPEARRIMDEYDQLCDAVERAEARKKELMSDMTTIAMNRDVIFAGRKLTKIEKAGAIAYAKAVKELLPNADLEKWRGKASSYWSVK